MSDKGLGWHYFGIGKYYGKYLAVSKCQDCRFLSEESGRVGSFGDFKYKCSADTGCAASKLGQGISVSDCKSYEANNSSSEKKSHGGGFGAGAGENILGGLGQLATAGGIDDMLGGAGKVGLGAAKLVGKGVGAVVSATAEALKETEEERAERLEYERKEDEEMKNYEPAMSKIEECVIKGDNAKIIQSINVLFSIIPYKALYEDTIDLQENVRNDAGKKIVKGIEKLKEQGDNENADLLQQQLDQTEWGIERIKKQERAAERKEKVDAAVAKTKEIAGKGVEAGKELFGKGVGAIKGLFKKKDE